MGKTSLFTLIAYACFSVVMVPGTTEAVVVSSASELVNAIEEANSGGDKTILLEDGTTLDTMLWVDADGVTVRSSSGNRDNVTIRGRGNGRKCVSHF